MIHFQAEYYLKDHDSIEMVVLFLLTNNTDHLYFWE